ncbi:bifunctional diguanylate cyclase/phosphodiesterase [Tumidithrix elongata]
MNEGLYNHLNKVIEYIQQIRESPDLPVQFQESLYTMKRTCDRLADQFNRTVHVIQALEQQVEALQQEKAELLYRLHTNTTPTLTESPDIDTLLAVLSSQMRQSMDVRELLEISALEIRQMLNADQVIVYRFTPGWSELISFESVVSEQWSLLGQPLPPIYYNLEWLKAYQNGLSKSLDDIQKAQLFPAIADSLLRFQICSTAAVAIPKGKSLWGLVIVHQYSSKRVWQAWELEFLERLAIRFAIDIHQVSLLETFQTVLQERQTAQTQLLHTTLHDALTGLPNRAGFMECLSNIMVSVQNGTSNRFAILFLDCDRFKSVNDSLGYSIGDHLLVMISERLMRCIRAGDVISRFSGDEFVILLEEVEGNAVRQVAEAIVSELQEPYNLGEHIVFSSASIGIVFHNTDYTSAEEILRDADLAMYHAKKWNRGQYSIFHPDMRLGALTRLQLEEDLRKAVERQEFQLHYQPIVSVENNQTVGFEALLRWQHPSRGFVPPLDFLGIAEETGLIIPIGKWVLYEACRQLRRWQEEFPTASPLYVSVNVSPLQVNQVDFIDRVMLVLKETGVEANCLKIEITETVLMENLEASRLKLESLRNNGIEVYIDDFGTGYSSFSYLQNLPIDVLKIDRAFIKELTKDEKSQRIVQTILRLASSMGIGIVAEGVETAEQLDCFTQMGNQSVQGYYISKPLESSAANSWIRSTL